MLTTEVETGEVFTDLRAWMTAVALVKDRGHCQNVTFGDDDDSGRLVKQARRLNRGWKPGSVPVVPLRVPTAERPLVDVVAMTNREPVSRPRERRVRRATGTTGSGKDPPPAEEPPPEHLERLRPLTAVARAYLKAERDRRMREVVDARPEISPDVFHLFDEDRS